MNARRWTARTLLLLVLPAALGACGGGAGSSSGTASLLPPAALSYPSPTTASVGIRLAPLSPSVQGQVTSYSVSPALPAGLTLDGTTGAISGTPTRSSADAAYTITAANPSGHTSFDWHLAVHPTANAGANQDVTTGQFVALDARASTTTPGVALTYQWTMHSAPTGSMALLASPRSSQPEFLADLSGTYIVDLVVSDGSLSSTVATVTVIASPGSPFTAPPPPVAPTLLTACTDISTPGKYLLGADLMSTTDGIPCISIHDTSAVTLDCGGHTLTDSTALNGPSLSLSHVQNLTIQNCTVRARQLHFDYLTDTAFVADTFTALTDGIAPEDLWILHGTRITFDHNSMQATQIQTFYGESLAFSHNAMTMPPGMAYMLGGFVWSAYGNHLQVTDNTMDGGWDGLLGTQYTYNGADDGVVLTDETDALVEHNIILNVFDTGIEWAGVLRTSTLHGNLVVNAGNAAFGGWYWQGIDGCLFTRNASRNATQMFLIFNYYGIRAAGYDLEHLMPADSGVYMQDNVFEGNTSMGSRQPASSAAYFRILGDPSAGGGTSGQAGERPFTLADFHRNNNVLSNNFFDLTMGAPDFTGPPDPTIIIDGGGNSCTAPAGAALPLKCQ